MSGSSTRFAFYLADGHFRQTFPYLLIISVVLHSLSAFLSQLLQKKASRKSPTLDLLIWIVAVSGTFLASILEPNTPTKTLLSVVSIVLLILFFIILRSAEKRNFITLH